MRTVSYLALGSKATVVTTFLFRPTLCMPATVSKELKDAQAELRRLTKRQEYMRKMPLSSHKLAMAVAMWWVSGKLLCMGLRYLETEYVISQKRLAVKAGMTDVGGADRADRLVAIPHEWRTKFLAKVRALTPEEEDAMANADAKTLELHGKAKEFLRELALVDFVEATNQAGIAVSARAVLERRGFLLDARSTEIQAKLRPLSAKALKWVARWQKRHGLSVGRLRAGSGVALDVQLCKAPGVARSEGACFEL